jgi:DNA repair exonuclease SbcCD ATPase subunit
MENRRDSSVWPGLALTFGGGLALGAVGMKLKQDSRRAEPTLDPRLLELVLNAVDARLQDRAAHNERRIREVQNQFQGQIAGIRATMSEQLNEFGAAVSMLVAQQVTVLLDARAAKIETAFEKEIAPLRAQVEEKARELVELRERLAHSEHKMLDAILANAEAYQNAVNGKEDPPPGGSSRRRKAGKASRLKGISLVSSFLIVTMSLLLVHYLY